MIVFICGTVLGVLLSFSGNNNVSAESDTWINNGLNTYLNTSLTGNVGIGTNTPRQKLSVGSYLDLYSGSVNNPSTTSIRSSSAGNLIANAASNGNFYINNDTGMNTFILGTGRVGVQDTAPSELVEIGQGGNLSLQANILATTDPGDIVFKDGNGGERSRIWSDPTKGTLNFRNTTTTGTNPGDICIGNCP